MDEPSPFKESKPEQRFRMLPSSDIAERGVVCSYMLEPKHVGIICAERGINADSFHNPALGVIFTVMCEMRDANRVLDEVTLTQYLHDKSLLDQIGGSAVVSELFTYLPTATNVSSYIDTLEEKLLLRAMNRICKEYAEKCITDQDDSENLLADLHRKVTELTLKGTKEEETLDEILDKTFERWTGYHEGSNMALNTGHQLLDRASPIRRGSSVIIAGRRKSGKSALAGGIVLNTACRAKKPCIVFTLEMPKHEWIDRLLSEQGSISQRRIYKDPLRQEDWNKAAEAIHTLRGSPLRIYDSIRTLPALCAKLRQWKAKNPEGILAVIDYLQLVRVPHERGRNREQEVALISGTLRDLTLELDIAMIELSQLNKDGGSRESESIENDCTAFWDVMQELDDHGNLRKGKENIRTVRIKMQRHGRPGDRIPFTFTGDVMRFTEEQMAVQEEML